MSATSALNQIEVSHPETLPDLVPLPLPPQMTLLPASGSTVLVVSIQNPPPETYSSSCSLQRFLGWGWGPRGNVSPWGQSHPTASRTPQGPASPCPLHANTCSADTQNATQMTQGEVLLKSIDCSTNTRRYYRLRKNPPSTLSRGPQAPSSPRQPGSAPGSTLPRMSAPCCPRPHGPQVPQPQSLRAEVAGSDPHIPFSQEEVEAQNGQVGARRSHSKSVPTPGRWAPRPRPRPLNFFRNRAFQVNTPDEKKEDAFT